MKRMYYVSRFARPLSQADLAKLLDQAVRNNRRKNITGFLVCLGDSFFQVLEGPTPTVDRLYHERIVPDPRHTDVICLKAENRVQRRMFPEWSMKVFNLSDQTDALPFAFRQMLTALLESSNTISQYTQPTVIRMLEHGINPTTVKPRRKRVTVLYTDIIGFSHFAEHLKARDMLGLVNSHVEACTHIISERGGEVNKLTGDGVLAYFSERSSDAAIDAGVSLVKEMKRRRSRAANSSPHRYLYGGVGLGNGIVYEGNVGTAAKRDFTILGNTVNQVSRLEAMTRDLGVRLTLGPAVVRQATKPWPFVSLGKQKLRGQSRAFEVFTIQSLPRLKTAALYERIKRFTSQA